MQPGIAFPMPLTILKPSLKRQNKLLALPVLRGFAFSMFILLSICFRSFPSDPKADALRNDEAIQIKGTLHYMASSKQIPQMEREFTLTLSGDAWQIQTRFPDSGRIIVDSYDGTNVASISRFSTSAATNADSSVVIEQVHIPNTAISTFAAQVWLALASSQSFPSTSPAKLPPVWHLDDSSLRSKNFTVQAEFELMSTPPHLPARVRYFSDGKVYLKDQQGISRSFSWPHPFDVGFLSAEYKTLTTRTFKGLTFPEEFVFTKYRPKRKGAHSPEEVLEQWSLRGIVRAITSSSPDSVTKLPPLNRTYIHDGRVATADLPLSATYFTTNGFIPPTNHPLVQASLAREIEAYRLQLQSSNTKRTKLFFIAALFGGITVFLGYQLVKNKHKQSKI